MLSINIFPSNKEHFIRLVEFCKEIIDLCDEQKIEAIIYGSLAVFVYTKNSNMNVNDIDILIKERDFKKIIKILNERRIRYHYDKRWHVLQILKNDLKLELDSIDFWQKGLARNYEELDLYGKRVKILSLNGLRKVYKKASEASEDNSVGNKKKFEALMRLGKDRKDE